MTKKEEFRIFIQNLGLTNNRMEFFTEEILSDGRENSRHIIAPREDILDMIDTIFDNELIGHYRDHVMTQIISWHA